MKKYIHLLTILSLSTSLFLRIEAAEGFYKNLFMDGGVGLSGMKSLPAADYLNYSYEFIAHNTVSLQNQVMVENENDGNGVLLYPDGEPRFQVIFTNGGGPETHGESLGPEGRERVRSFYYKGGSYTGACAGAYITTLDDDRYYKIWPGSMTEIGINMTTVGGFIPANSPLLNYYDYGGDNYIAGIVHNNGGYASNIPPGTEILLYHDKPGTELDSQPNCWAYKDNDTTGRIVNVSPHPENEFDGELLDFMAAILQYAVDGLAPPSTKGPLANGELRVMNKSTSDNDPINTKIGDMQYHHFTIDLSGGATNLVVTLDGDDAFDMNLYLKKDTFAFASLAGFADTAAGADKSIPVDTAASGTWYIGVECATTVVAEMGSWYYEYSGQLEVLNGVEYTIKADYNLTDIHSQNGFLSGALDRLVVNREGKNISICVKNNLPYKLKIFNVKGRLCWEPKTSQTVEKYIWQPKSTGMYIVCLESGKDILTKRFTVVK